MHNAADLETAAELHDHAVQSHKRAMRIWLYTVAAGLICGYVVTPIIVWALTRSL